MFYIESPVSHAQPQQLPRHRAEVPARRARVPCPARKSLVPPRRADIRREHEGFSLIDALIVRLRQQRFKHRRALGAFPKAQRRNGEPYCPMGVLPAVFAEALAVAGDIAGAALTVGVRRIEQLYEPVLSVPEPEQRRIHCRSGARLCPEARQHRPALCHGVDALPAAERFPIGIERAQVPFPVEGRVRRAPGLGGILPVPLPAFAADPLQQLRKARGAVGKEPAQPHALPADSVERVVPVAAAGVRQPALSEAAVYAAFKRCAGVFEHRRALRGLFRALIAVVLLVPQRR